MFGRQKTGSVLCPSCGLLVGVGDAQCLHCGRRRPGLFGFAAALRDLGHDMGFAPLVMWACGAIYIAMLVVGREQIQTTGLLSLMSPGGETLFLFGASGAVPVFHAGRWWTVLSAPWLHAGMRPHRVQHDGRTGPGPAPFAALRRRQDCDPVRGGRSGRSAAEQPGRGVPAGLPFFGSAPATRSGPPERSSG